MNSETVHAGISEQSALEQIEGSANEQEDVPAEGSEEESSLLEGLGEYKFIKIIKDKSQDPSKSPPPKTKPVAPPTLTVVPNTAELMMYTAHLQGQGLTNIPIS